MKHNHEDSYNRCLYEDQAGNEVCCYEQRERIVWRRGQAMSECGRFMLEALYEGTTRPRSYYLYDLMQQPRRRYEVLTQAEGKRLAQRISSEAA